MLVSATDINRAALLANLPVVDELAAELAIVHLSPSAVSGDINIDGVAAHFAVELRTLGTARLTTRTPSMVTEVDKQVAAARLAFAEAKEHRYTSIERTFWEYENSLLHRKFA